MCYSCTGRDNDGCMTNPEIAARRVSCSSGLCSIVRNEKFDGSGIIKIYGFIFGDSEDVQSIIKFADENRALIVHMKLTWFTLFT